MTKGLVTVLGRTGRIIPLRARSRRLTPCPLGHGGAAWTVFQPAASTRGTDLLLFAQSAGIQRA